MSTQWTNKNKYRKYPFTDDAVLTMISESDGSSYELSNSVLVGLRFITYNNLIGYYGTGYREQLTLKEIELTQAGTEPIMCKFTFIFYIFYLTGLADLYTCDISIPTNAVFPSTVNKKVSLPFPASEYAKEGNYNLTCIFDDGVEGLAELPLGKYTFQTPPHYMDLDSDSWTGATILPSRIVTLPFNTYSIRGRVDEFTELNIEMQPLLTGDIYLKEGYNCSLTLNPADNTITIGAVLGAGKGVSCEVLPNARHQTNSIAAVNGMIPDSKGNISIATGSGIVIGEPENPNTLKFNTTIDDSKLYCGKDVEEA